MKICVPKSWAVFKLCLLNHDAEHANYSMLQCTPIDILTVKQFTTDFLIHTPTASPFRANPPCFFAEGPLPISAQLKEELWIVCKRRRKLLCLNCPDKCRVRLIILRRSVDHSPRRAISLLQILFIFLVWKRHSFGYGEDYVRCGADSRFVSIFDFLIFGPICLCHTIGVAIQPVRIIFEDYALYSSQNSRNCP